MPTKKTLTADTLALCFKACKDDAACKRWEFEASSKTCKGITSDACNERYDADGWVNGEKSGSDTITMGGCTGTAAPGGVVWKHEHTAGTSSCTAAASDANYFVFDKCMKEGATGSYAVFCSADTKVILNKYADSTDCTGTAESREIVAACTATTTTTKSITATWWGACGNTETALPATVKAVDDTCTMPDGCTTAELCLSQDMIAKPDAVHSAHNMVCEGTTGNTIDQHWAENGISCDIAETRLTEDNALVEFTTECCWADEKDASAAPAGRRASAALVLATIGTLFTAVFASL